MYKIIDLDFQTASKKYGDEWNLLVESSDTNPSLLPGWMNCVYSAFKCSDSSRVFMLSDSGTGSLVGVIPYYIKNRISFGISFKSLEFGGNRVSYHQEIVTKKLYEVMFREFVKFTYQQERWGLMTASNLCVTGETFNAILTFANQSKYILTEYPIENSPYLTLKNDWGTLLSLKARKFRYKVNKREKDQRANKSWLINWFETGGECDQLLNDLFYIEERSWKTNSDMAITGRPIEKEYYQNLVPYLASNNMLFANVLYIDGKPAAYNLCYKFNRKVGQIKTSFNNEYRNLSPGSLVVEDALRRCYSQGFSEFDFLGDVMPHKILWTKDVREHKSLTIYAKRILPSLLGIGRRINSTISNHRV